MTQGATLQSLVLSCYLFDQGYPEEEFNLKFIGVEELLQNCLKGLHDCVSPTQTGLAEREWGVAPDATPFEKIKAAFRSVMGQTPVLSNAQRGNLVETYRSLRNEKFKESRLILWKALGPTDMDPDTLKNCSGNEVAEKFEGWLDQHPEKLQITCLNLGYHSLTHLPPEIGRFTQLESLFLFGNHLKSLPPEIGKLTQLKGIHLNGNQLKKLPPEIGHLEKLQVLRVDNNALEELPPQIGNCSMLEELSLAENKLKQLPNAMGNLHNLKELTLHTNQLEKLPLEMISLTRLEKLDLQRNQFKVFPKGVCHLTSLVKLKINSNLLREIPEAVAQLPKLEKFYIDDNLMELPDAFGDPWCLNSKDIQKLAQMGWFKAPSLKKTDTIQLLDWLLFSTVMLSGLFAYA